MLIQSRVDLSECALCTDCEIGADGVPPLVQACGCMTNLTAIDLSCTHCTGLVFPRILYRTLSADNSTGDDAVPMCIRLIGSGVVKELRLCGELPCAAVLNPLTWYCDFRDQATGSHYQDVCHSFRL